MALAACGPESPPPPGETFDCAIGADAEFAAVCTLERAEDAFVLHHPDGGFRRLNRDPATGTLTPRDGAEVLVPAGDSFTIGADRYRIPPALLAPPRP